MHVLKKLSIVAVIMLTIVIISAILGSVTFYVFLQSPMCERREGEVEEVGPHNITEIYCRQYPLHADRTFARFVRMPLCSKMSLSEKYALWKSCF
jgi:hypothetical protein